MSQYHSWGIIEMLNHTALFTAIQSMIQAYLKLFQMHHQSSTEVCISKSPTI